MLESDIPVSAEKPSNVTSGTLEDKVKYLSTEERKIFFCLFLFVFVVSVIGNIAAIVSTTKRKRRYIQKTCIISLALSDLLTAVVFSINYLETLSHPLINWTIGETLCSLIPTLQIHFVTLSSLALVIIALDRYRNVVHALESRWSPNLHKCIFVAIILWICCGGISFPMYYIFEHKTLTVISFGPNNTIHKEVYYFCVGVNKKKLTLYNCCMIFIIFLPLLLIFLWLYYKIAQLLWHHRKPLGSGLQKKENSSANETSTTQLKSSEAPTRTSNENTLNAMIARKKNIRVERNIRTLKIIISLMIVFLVSKLPYWIFNIMRLVEDHYNQPKHWVLNYSLNCLGLLSCALNPFLYTFISPTYTIFMKIVKTLNDFMCKICCCCCSNTDFDDFEKDKENPFIMDNKNGPNRADTLRCHRYPPRVKFEEQAKVQVYCGESQTSQDSNENNHHKY